MASLSVDELGSNKFKLCYRELLPGPDGAPAKGPDGRILRRARSLVIEGKDAWDVLSPSRGSAWTMGATTRATSRGTSVGV